MAVSSTGPSLIVVETCATLLVAAAAFVCPRLGATVFARAEGMLGRVARKRWTAVLIVTATVLCGRLCLLPVMPIPEPFIHGDFSYLLAGDTFASGRLTNPTHPLWVNFESFHISHQPTYMSMYFPAQGLVLAAGQRLFGHPWFGAWLVAGLMCGAICWMLQQYLPPGWAFFGGMLAVVRLGIFSYWMNAYRGGALAAVGGALVLGSLPLITRRHAYLRGAVLMGLGAALLVNNRPYEGFLVCAPVAVVILFWLYRRPQGARGVAIRQVVLPITLILAATATAMAYYNWRVFGDPTTLPYKINRATYSVAQVFVWQPLNPEPVYRHKVMRDFYLTVELPDALQAHTVLGFLKTRLKNAAVAGFFFFGMLLVIPLPAMRRAMGSRRMRFLAVCGAVYVIGLALNVWLFPHYAAPAACLIYALLMQAMRYLRQWRPRGEPAGLFLVRGVAVTCLVLCVARVFAAPLHIQVDRWPSMWYGTELGLQRANVVRQLAALPGRQLAIVRYSANHFSEDEWVYNAADIDGSRVVWAREMDTASTARLIRYFAGRKVWLVEPDSQTPRVTPYPAIDDRPAAPAGSTP